MHSGKKELIDRAIKIMMELNKEEKDFAPALVILAVCKYFQKKSNEGRNFLKTLSKQVYQPVYAEHFEMGWLMLADFLITVSLLLTHSKENMTRLKSTAASV